MVWANGENATVDHRRQDVQQAVKNACDQLNGDGVDPRNYVEQLVWLFFLKAFDEIEQRKEDVAAFDGSGYARRLEDEFRWSVWASRIDQPDAMLEFVNGRLWQKLQNLGDDPLAERFRRIFSSIRNHSRRGTSFAKVVQQVNQLHFSDATDVIVLSEIYEDLLKRVAADSAGYAGEFYTQRHLIWAMVQVVRPKMGDRIYDPCFGTAGFLAESADYIRTHHGAMGGGELDWFNEETFFGVEHKPLTYLLGTMNMLLHQIEGARLEQANTLELHSSNVPEKHRYSVILANPPFGGKVAREMQTNFTIRSGSTEVLFLQHIMANLAKGGRAGVIVPEGVLFRGGPDAKVRERLLTGFDVHTILSLPAGCFLPYTGVKTSVLFFDRRLDGKTTDNIWYYDLKNDGFELKQTRRPISGDQLPDFVSKWEERGEGENSWLVSIDEISEKNWSLTTPNLRQELWKVRDTYRSTGSIGMTVVIHAAVLLFLRWADFYESEQEESAAFDQIDYTPSLPNHLRWAALEKLSEFDLEKLWRNELSANFKAAINTPLGHLLRQFAYVIEFNPPNLAEPLFQLFCWVGSLPFETAEDRSAYGRALESLISQTVSGRDGGQFITPQPIVDLMVALADPKPGERVYDPCFGIGGLLVASARQLMKNAHLLPPQACLDLRGNNIFGIEIDSEAYVIGLTRLILEGIDCPRLELDDTLERPLPQIFNGSTQEQITPNRKNVFARPGRSQAKKGNLETLRSDEGFDCILASPPWGGKQTSSRYAKHFPIPVGSTEGLFLEHVMYSLRPGGRAVIALPDGILFRQGRESKLRERLLTDFSVEGVIALPPGAFTPYTGVKVSLLVLHRKPPAPSVRFFRVEDFPTTRRELANYTQVELELKAKELVSQFRSSETTENLWNTPIESLAQRSWELVVKRSGDNVLLERLKELQAADPGLEIRPLRDIAEVFLSIARHQYRDYTTKDSHDPEVTANILRVSDMREFGIREPELFLTRLGEARLEGKLDSKHWLCPGDVVLSTSGTIGKVTFFTDSVGFRKTLAADGLVVIRPKGEIITPEFLFTLLRSSMYQEWLRGHAQGSSIQHLSIQILKDLPVPVPAIAIQHRLWKRTKGEITDVLATLLQGVTGVNDDPILKWLERSKAASALAHIGEEAEYRLRWLNQLNKELLDLRNQWAHNIQPKRISPEITPWLSRMADAARALQDVQEIPSGTGRIAVFENAQLVVQEAITTLSNVSVLADPIRKVSSDISRLISQEVKFLLENTQIDIHPEPTSVVVGTPNEVVLKIKNSAAVALRNIRVRTTPNIGTGKTSYLMEDTEFAMPLIVEPQQTSGTYGFLVTWIAQRLDGTSVHGETSLSLAIRSLRESSVANLGASPYVVGKPIEREEMFYGRDDVIEQIKDHLNDETQSNVILLEGNRRTGKTSILKQLQKRDNLPRWLAVECSLQGADSMATHHVFRLFARRIWEACTVAGISTWLPSQPPPTPDKPLKSELVKALSTTFSEAHPFEAFELYLQSVLEAIQPCKLLLMLDEFDKLQEGIDQGITNPQVPENIRYLLHTYSEMSAIITGSRRLKRLREEYWSALFGFGYQIGISALPLDGARKLVTEPVEGRLLFLPEARDRIVNLCACQPFLIQSLCTRIFEQSKRQTERTVTPALVESAVIAMVEDNEHFRTLWNYAGTERRRMILAICQRFSSSDDPTNLDFLETKFEEFGIRVPKKRGLGEDLDFLRELELIDFDSTQGREAYALSIPLMEKWIQRHIDFEDLKREAMREAEEVL